MANNRHDTQVFFQVVHIRLNCILLVFFLFYSTMKRSESMNFTVKKSDSMKHFISIRNKVTQLVIKYISLWHSSSPFPLILYHTR